MTNLLIVTGGNTDLQPIVIDREGRRRRVEFWREAIREAHDALIDERISYEIDEQATKEDQLRDLTCAWNKCAFTVRNAACDTSTEAEWIPTDPLILAPAKLAGIKSATRKNYRPDAVVVFNTRREQDKKEPAAIGPLLSRWLAQVFGLKWGGEEGAIGSGCSGWVDYIDGRMRLEGDDGINSEIVARIDRTFVSLGVDRWDRVVFALSGGIPALREEIRAAARFRFAGAHFREFRNPERGVETATSHFTPAESYRRRGQARDLVLGGNFAGAAAVASALEHRKDEAPWVQVVKATAAYFDGTLEIADELPSFLSTLLADDAPRCLLPAVRAQAALQSGRLSDAIFWTSSFRDAALIDYVARLPFVTGIDEITRVIDVDPSGQIDAELLQSARLTKPALRKSGENRYSYFNSRDSDRIWYRIFERSAESFTDDASALRKFSNRLQNRGKGDSPPPSEYRNILAHSRLTSEQMKEAEQTFVRTGLWAAAWSDQRISEQGSAFLDQPLTRNVFRALGVEDPALIYRDLVEGLCAVIETFPHQDR